MTRSLIKGTRALAGNGSEAKNAELPLDNQSHVCDCVARNRRATVRLV